MMRCVTKMKKGLYIHGYGSKCESSSTGDVVRTILEEKKYNVDMFPCAFDDSIGMTNFLNSIAKHYDVVIGHSLGGFFTSLVEHPNRILINPCLIPINHRDMLGFEDDKVWLEYAICGLGMTCRDCVGIFSKDDELFSYERFLRDENIYEIDGGHRPTYEELSLTLKELI